MRLNEGLIEREAPGHLLRALRVIDPTAEFVYMGEGRWLLGRLASTAAIRVAGQRLVESCKRAVEGRKPTPLDARRYLFAQLRLNGFQPTSEYVFQGEPDSSVVIDQQVMDWMYHNTSDSELETAVDADMVKAREDARADMLDTARHAAAWKYAFTRSHSVTRFDDPTKARQKAGRTIHKTISHRAAA